MAVDGESPASLNTDLFQQLSSLTKEGKGKGERKGGGKGCYIPDNYLWVKFHLCSLLKLLVSPPILCGTSSLAADTMCMYQRVITTFIIIWNWKQPKTQSTQHNGIEIKQKAKPDEQLGADSSLPFEKGSQ